MKLRALIVPCLAAIGGMLAGAVAASYLWITFGNERLFASFEAGVATRYSVLDQIRCGNVAAAIQFLELQMDGDLVGMAQMVGDGHKVSEGVRRIAAKEREARRASGYKPAEAVLAKPVEEALDLLANGTSALEKR